VARRPETGEKRYWTRVWALAQVLESDGCTGVPDWYLPACHEHDIAYRTGMDPLGRLISRAEADRRLRDAIQARSPFGRLSPMSWWRWAAVRAFGRRPCDRCE